MAFIVPLQAIPSQSLTFQADGQRYAMTIRECNGIMAVTLSVNEVEILSGVRLTLGEGLIPYQYLEADGGNFAIATDTPNAELAYYTAFGLTQFLVYFTADELAEARA